MRKLFILLSCTALLQACSKDPSPNTTVTVTNTDTILVTNDGVTHTYIASRQLQLCEIRKTPYNSVFALSLSADAKNFMTIGIGMASGPVNSIGVYRVSPGDSLNSFIKSINRYTETFNGGEAYEVDSTVVNIITAEGRTLIGSFDMYVRNVNRQKKVTGILRCHNAAIN